MYAESQQNNTCLNRKISIDKDGYIYLSNVNEMTEMVEMMAASRSYQNNVEVVNTTRQLMMRTVDMIKG